MKRLPELFPLLLVFAFVGACEAPPAQEDRGMEADSPVEDVEQEQQEPFDTVSLSIQDGAIVVEPDSVGIPPGRTVMWQAAEGADPADVWIVAFADGTPMQDGYRVFNGGSDPDRARGTVSRQAEVGTHYKYWVFYPTGDGEYLQVDPELWVIND